MTVDILIDLIKNNKCLPVIGAGFSLNAELPDDKTMPTWPELTSALADKIKTKETAPLQVFQEFQDKSDRTTLIQTIENLLHKGIAKPGFAHRELVRIPYFDVICTTNYDDLLESACRQEEISANIIAEKQQLSMYGSDTGLKIFKMHGDLEHVSELIITKTDYEKYGTEKEPFVIYLKTLLITKTPLFLGFSMTDPNFKQIKNMIDTMMSEAVRRGYIVLFDPTPEEIREYKKLNLQVIPIITNGHSKSECMLDFLKQIHQTQISIPSKLSVSANKTILFKNQTLAIRTVTDALPSQISIVIKNENNEKIHEMDMADAIKIDDGLFEKQIVLSDEQWKESHDYTIYATLGDQTESDSFRLSGPAQIVAQTDRSVYMYGNEIILTAIVPQASIGSFIDYKIVNSKKETVQEGKIEIKSENTGIFQDVIKVEGEEWKKRGEEFTVFIQYGDKQESDIFFTSDFGATVELDQKVYSWTDKVYITIVAPDFNKNPTAIDYIGTDDDCIVTIRTSKDSIRRYKLQETREDTGIFIGELTLTGIPGMNVNSDGTRKYSFGTTSGIGPNDGKLACLHSDQLDISFQYSDESIVTASALIRWNIGEIQFLEPVYTFDELAKIRVIDPDMNLDPDEIDSFKIKVQSDSDEKGIEIPVYETNTASGIFEGVISFDKDSSSDTGKLKVADGDTILAKYMDTTLPHPYTPNRSLEIGATAKVFSEKKHYSPLERLKIENVNVYNSIPSKGEKIGKTDVAHIKVKVSNENEPCSFVIALQIRDKDSAVHDLLFQPMRTDSKSSVSHTFIWNPDSAGIFEINVYLLNSIDIPEPLCSPHSKTIEINDH